jgi:hypothetical protein
MHIHASTNKNALQINTRKQLFAGVRQTPNASTQTHTLTYTHIHTRTQTHTRAIIFPTNRRTGT